jgi:hypothetical protein
MTKFASCAIATILAILSFSTVEAGDRSLKAKDIRSLFPGKYEARVQGYKVVIHARGNGALAGAAFNRTDKGRWWVKGNRLCVSWSNWTNGKATCGRIRRAGNWYVSRSGSGNSMKFRRL